MFLHFRRKGERLSVTFAVVYLLLSPIGDLLTNIYHTIFCVILFSSLYHRTLEWKGSWQSVPLVNDKAESRRQPQVVAHFIWGFSVLSH